MPKKLLLFLFCIGYSSEALLLSDRNYNLRIFEPSILTWHSAYQTIGELNLSGNHLTNCHERFSPKAICYPQNGLTYKENDDSITFRPLAGIEYRKLDTFGENVPAMDLGIILSGSKSKMRFLLDARIVSERQEIRPDRNYDSYSWDREFVEIQEQGNDASYSYISYARFKTAFEIILPYGIVSFRRDAPNWGPSTQNSLTFNQSAVPFNYFTYKTNIGPFSVVSLWGRLAIDGNGQFRSSTQTRSVYAHRYEWKATNDLTFGLNEQLILFDTEDPAALIPVVPLFMEKGQGLENNNNGNISFDFAWRFLNRFRIYSEFFIDDMSDPSQLFNDFWKNRWAYVGGLQYAKQIDNKIFSTNLEYTRIEPWVYTHYKEKTAQTLHRNHPIGNQLGPNSQEILLTSFIRSPQNWYISADVAAYWKGDSLGSDVEDTRDLYHLGRKEFLAGAKQKLRLGFEAQYNFNLWYLNFRTQLDDKQLDWIARLGFSM